MKLLTIAIPTYNRLDYLKQNLENILIQVSNHRDDVDVLVSNNCSPDATKEYLDELQKKYSFLQVVNQKENIGPDGNFISIFEANKNKFLYIISDDDILLDNSLNRIVEFLKLNNDISFTFANNVMFYDHFDASKIETYKRIIHNDDNMVTNDKKEFINNVKLEFTFLSSLIFNTTKLSAIDTYKKYLNTNWAQSFIALDCMRGECKLGIIGKPIIAQNQLMSSPSYNPFYVFGPSLKSLIDFSIECGFNKKQMYKLFYKRCKTMYRSIGKYKIDKKPLFKHFKPMFKVTWYHISFWFMLYPALFIPRFVYKKMGNMYYKNKI